MNISPLGLIAVAVACLLTFCVTRFVLQDHSLLRPAGLVAACVAGLAFLGLTRTNGGWVEFILLPYAALALTLLLLFLLALFGKLFARSFRGGRPEGLTRFEPPHCQDRVSRVNPRPERPSPEQPRPHRIEGQLRPEDRFGDHANRGLRKSLSRSDQQAQGPPNASRQ